MTRLFGSRLAESVKQQRGGATPAFAQRKQVQAVSMPDACAASLVQLQFQHIASHSSQTAQLKACAEMMAGRNSNFTLQRKEDEELLQGKFAVAQLEADLRLMQSNCAPAQRAVEEELLQRKFDTIQREEMPNDTGLPDQLKSGVESLSGMSMDHVKVHYNSNKPSLLQAHAYAQGSEIHVAPGQEQHLPHEAWHVVQQMQGRVQPTIEVSGMQVNDDAGLESEATSMGDKAAQLKIHELASPSSPRSVSLTQPLSTTFALQREIINGIDVRLDGANYPVWTQGGIDWHLTSKEIGRWHVTKADRSMHYWFTIEAGVVDSTKPTAEERGSQRAKHAPLDDAPDYLRSFIKRHINSIYAVQEKI